MSRKSSRVNRKQKKIEKKVSFPHFLELHLKFYFSLVTFAALNIVFKNRSACNITMSSAATTLM